jgi:hypothetical protein
MLVLLARASGAAAQCPPAGGTALPPGTGEDLEVTSPYTVCAGTYHYGNVNVYGGGSLTFDDAAIDFWATSILIENQGSIIAGSPEQPIGTNGGTVTFHLYGMDQGAKPFGTAAGQGGQGIICKSPGGLCGVPPSIWNSNADPTNPVKSTLPGGVTDNFYAYDPMPYDDGGTVKGYFGYKVLALSYGGTLQLFGKKGATYGTVDPSNSGTSWVRLAQTLPVGGTTLVLDRPVDWEAGDQIVVTTTDYLPGHSEQLTIAPDGVSADKTTITVMEHAQYIHSGQHVDLSMLPARLGMEINAAETRAAVALLSRSIRIVSEGDTFGQPFPSGPGQYFGGHTIVRQGFAAYQVQGVEFYQLGQGGRIAHYPVHFHMARDTPPNTFIQDCSVHDSMTRWYTVHGTHGLMLARNVGYLSIGHGYYIEDGTEIQNQFFSNIGIFARSAVDNVQNPRQVPGILSAPDGIGIENVPYHTDLDHPAVFWIMNGYNDFQYNMAAGAGACGACFWLVPGSISGPSRHQHWESYASIQSTPGRAATAPLKSFRGNYCSSAMNSFNVVGNTAPCLGIGPNDATDLPAVVNPLTPVSGNLDYYPTVSGGGGRFPTRCDPSVTDCSTVPMCAEGNEQNCEVTVLDHYTSSFHWTEENYAAIWLRPQWYLLIDSVLSDVQNGGLTFITGGDYTHAETITGHWSLARHSVFIGQTQDDNPLASNAGPFNAASGLACDTQQGNNCLSRAEGVAFPLSNFGNNQRLFNIYDGPSYQDANAYLNITKTTIPDCAPNPNGNCSSSASMYGRVLGMPRDGSTCYLPNAAIAWKQPNGFYYPPAFHSRNLFFQNVDIRHFVIEPQFLANSFKTDPTNLADDYCTWSTAMFDNFTAIDRQTVLNDDDGSLTGLVDTVSVNEDSFFSAPVQTIECESDMTARTSPYEYVTTVVYPGCAANVDSTTALSQCGSDWAQACSTPACYGVPLYRQYMTTQEKQNGALKDDGSDRSIRLMAMALWQRSNLTANNGLFYVDTTVGMARQSSSGASNFNVFQPGQTYYLFLLYALPDTQQTYQLYVGNDPTFDPTASVNLVRANIASAPLGFAQAAWPAQWTRGYDPGTGILTVTMTMAPFADQFGAARAASCGPASFCAWNGSACVCALDPSDPLYAECIADNSAICTYAGNAVDCPQGGCLGFSVTLPASFATDPMPDPRPDPVPFPQNADWNVSWTLASQDLAGTCYQPPTSAIIGTDRSEKLVGTKGDDIILGKGGNDRIWGRGGNDMIFAGPGNDVVHGGRGSDYVDGGSGRDRVMGGRGKDVCVNVERRRSCK